MDQNDKFDNSLTHYGVMGMKWGKRKGSTANTSTAPRRRMSNKELQSRVKRLKLEAEFNKLNPKPESKSKLESLAKTAGTIATITTAGVTIYKNMDEIMKMYKKVSGS